MSIPISNIQQLPYDVTGKILNHLNDKDLSKISSTHTNFNRQVKHSKNQLFSKTALLIQERQNTVNSLENLNINIKSSLLNRFIYFINDPKSSVLYAIFRLAKKIFPRVQKIAYQQQELRSGIKDQLSTLSEAKTLLRHDILFYRHMEDIFGDIHAFEKVPVLDIGKKQLFIDIIRPEDMIASVMRGTDTDGRHFISVKALDNGKIGVQTYFEWYPNKNGWVSTGHGTIFLPFPIMIFADGTVNHFQTELYEKLKTLIRTGETTLAYRRNVISPFEEHTIRLV
jgi:hypothetical protein